MTVLVSAASRHGATAEIASAVGQVLVERGLKAEVHPITDVSGVRRYDAVVMGSAVYAGRWLSDAKDFIDRFGDELRSRPVFLFSSGPVGAPPKPEEDPVDAAPVMEATAAREHRVFAGKLTKKELGFAERAVATALRAPEGDFRDWADIRAWAGTIADALAAGR